MIQPSVGEIPTASLIALYAVWETLKMVGMPQAIKSKIMGEKSVFTQFEKQEMNEHYEQCRACNSHQKRQVQLLEKISDSAIKIQTMIERAGK